MLRGCERAFAVSAHDALTDSAMTAYVFLFLQHPQSADKFAQECVQAQLFAVSDKTSKFQFEPISEQLCAIEAIKQNKNVVIDAVPGAGKTATVQIIAEAFPDKNFLVIMYNKQL